MDEEAGKIIDEMIKESFSQQAVRDKEKGITSQIKTVYKEIDKAPMKPVFKPTPVKPVEVKIEEKPMGIPEEEHSALESHGVLKDFFEIEDELGFTEGEKLRDIWGYLGEKYPRAELSERIHQLRKIESKIGQPGIGQSRLGKIHAYISVQKTIDNAQRWRAGILGRKVK